MIDGLDEALVGMTAGETKNFTAPLAGGDREGQDADVTVTVQSVKERELPELDDDFAQLASEFDTLEELRGRHAQAGRAGQAVRAGRPGPRQGARARCSRPIDDPGARRARRGRGALATSRARTGSRTTSTAPRSTRAPARRLQTQFLLDAIAEKEEVKVGQPELIEYLVMTRRSSTAWSPNEFAKAVDEDGQIPAMVAEVARRKALATVLEKAKVVDAAGNEVDLNALTPARTHVEDREGHDHEGHDHEGHDHEGHDHEGHDHA